MKRYVPCNVNCRGLFARAMSQVRAESFLGRSGCFFSRIWRKPRQERRSDERKMKELAERCFSGEVTLPKAVIWLSGAVCLLAGIVYGLKPRL